MDVEAKDSTEDRLVRLGVLGSSHVSQDEEVEDRIECEEEGFPSANVFNGNDSTNIPTGPLGSKAVSIIENGSRGEQSADKEESEASDEGDDNCFVCIFPLKCDPNP